VKTGILKYPDLYSHCPNTSQAKLYVSLRLEEAGCDNMGRITQLAVVGTVMNIVFRETRKNFQ
jgi:hypothetical protein